MTKRTTHSQRPTGPVPGSEKQLVGHRVLRPLEYWLRDLHRQPAHVARRHVLHAPVADSRVLRHRTTRHFGWLRPGEPRAAIGSRTLAENIAIIEANQLTAHPVQTIADIERDPHWQGHQLLVDVPNGQYELTLAMGDQGACCGECAGAGRSGVLAGS